MQERIAADILPFLEADDAIGIFGRVAHAVDAAYAGHDDNVAPAAKQGGGGAQAELF
jgi:hypothetical protein